MDVIDRLRAIWEEELGVSVSDDDDFFDLGGDSLMALTIAKRAEEAGIPMAPSALLEHSTLHDLAASVAHE